MNLFNQLFQDLNPNKCLEMPKSALTKAIEEAFEKAVADEVGLIEDEGMWGICASCLQEAQLLGCDQGIGWHDYNGHVSNHVDIQLMSKCCEASVLDPDHIAEWITPDVCEDIGLEHHSDAVEKAVNDYIFEVSHED